MKLRIKFLPLLKTGFLIFYVFAFFTLFVAVFYLYKTYGGITIIIFSLFFAILLMFSFYILANRYFLELDEEAKTIFIKWIQRKKSFDVAKVEELELYQTKRSYILSTRIDGKTYTLALSGPLDFEEPQFLPFLRKLEKLNPTVKLGANMHEIMHGQATFQAWSNKMYFLYWVYVSLFVFSYILLLLLIFIFK